MDDLLQSQIQESCKLALPNGLKELMSDISREVLRAQPANLYDFITKYLAALLVTRENLSIAGRVCQNVCDPPCHLKLDDELKQIFEDEEDAVRAKQIIEEYFKSGNVEERSLMVKLVKKFSITRDQLEQVQEVVRNAFMQHLIDNTDNTIREMPSDIDEISHAAIHTLELYSKTGPTEEEYNQKATRIQAAYRAYGVRRLCTSKQVERKERPRIQFSSDVSDTDLSTESLKSDHAESPNIETTEESGSQIQKARNEHSVNERAQSDIRDDIGHKERIQSFINYEDVIEKRITSITNENESIDKDTDIYEGRERRSSNSEVHFKEPIINEKIYEESTEDNDLYEFDAIDNEALVYLQIKEKNTANFENNGLDEVGSVDYEGYFESKEDTTNAIEDAAVIADYETDNSVEEEIY